MEQVLLYYFFAVGPLLMIMWFVMTYVFHPLKYFFTHIAEHIRY